MLNIQGEICCCCSTCKNLFSAIASTTDLLHRFMSFHTKKQTDLTNISISHIAKLLFQSINLPLAVPESFPHTSCYWVLFDYECQWRKETCCIASEQATKEWMEKFPTPFIGCVHHQHFAFRVCRLCTTKNGSWLVVWRGSLEGEEKCTNVVCRRGVVEPSVSLCSIVCSSMGSRYRSSLASSLESEDHRSSVDVASSSGEQLPWSTTLARLLFSFKPLIQEERPRKRFQWISVGFRVLFATQPVFKVWKVSLFIMFFSQLRNASFAWQSNSGILNQRDPGENSFVVLFCNLNLKSPVQPPSNQRPYLSIYLLVCLTWEEGIAGKPTTWERTKTKKLKRMQLFEIIERHLPERSSRARFLPGLCSVRARNLVEKNKSN